MLTRAALLLTLAACATAPVAPPPVVVQGCRLTRPPPPAPAITGAECDGYEICLSTVETAQLASWADEARAWMRDAWGRCAAPAHASRNLLTLER